MQGVGSKFLRNNQTWLVALLVFVASAVAYRSSHRDLGAWTIDDAAITYAAAYEYADHGSFATSVEGTPVESYSNPVVFFVTALLRWGGGFDPVRTHAHLEMLVFATMATLAWSMLRRWTSGLAAALATLTFVVLQLATPATWLWYGSGLENVWVSAGLVFLAWSVARSAGGARLWPAWGALVFVVAITRPEAPIYVLAYFAALALVRPPEIPAKRHLRAVAKVAIVTLVLYLLFLGWRRVCYGDWWPNTYYAKVVGKTFTANFTDYVLGQVLRYGWTALFAASVLGLVLVGALEALVPMLGIFLLATLALPITAGADWMGEHRFATSFITVSHVTYAALLAACIANARRNRKTLAILGGLLVLPGLVLCERNALTGHIDVNPVTVGQIAHDQGGARWLHQMRLGLPNAVVMVPDAGGSLLVGGFQLVDSASLAEFQQARILRGVGNVRGMLARYHEERRPDLIDFNLNSAIVDGSWLGTRYWKNETHLAARADLVAVTSIDSHAVRVIDTPSLRIHLSPETVLRSAPHGLVRFEILVEWIGGAPPASTMLHAHIAGDDDVISLAPYQPLTSGIERRGLLLGAPEAGDHVVTIELVREGLPVERATLATLHVDASNDLSSTIAEITRNATPWQAAQRLAWLHVQLAPRLTMRRFSQVMHAIFESRVNGARVGRNIHKLRANAAASVPAPEVLEQAKRAAWRGVVATCSSDVPCLGRQIDALRRLGYAYRHYRTPEVRDTLAKARDRLGDATRAGRYELLVGLTLAEPDDIDLQRAILAERR